MPSHRKPHRTARWRLWLLQPRTLATNDMSWRRQSRSLTTSHWASGEFLAIPVAAGSVWVSACLHRGSFVRLRWHGLETAYRTTRGPSAQLAGVGTPDVASPATNLPS